MSFLGAYYPGDPDQYLVQTPYGEGLIIRTRPNPRHSIAPIKEIRLLDWEKAANSTKLSSKRNSTLYSTQDYPSIEPKKGDDVETPYGRGHVVETVTVRILSKNLVLLKYHIILDSWRLAGRSRVKCYLFSHQVRTLRKKTLMEMNATERVEFALRQKSAATIAFSEKKFQQALNIYAGCIDAVRNVQHDNNNNNECRADLIEVMVTYSNNAATCCIQLRMWEEAFRFSKNAIILLNALYNKRGMKIHNILIKDRGYCDTKLFGEWRVKSRFVMARSLYEKDDFEEALEELREAREYIMYYVAGEGCENTPTAKESVKRLRALEKQMASLRIDVITKKKALLQKEKARAMAMFSVESSDSKNEQEDATVAMNGNATMDQINRSDSDEKKELLKKKVSFASKLEETREIPEDEVEEEDAWYHKHKEAFILLALGGIFAISIYLGIRKKSNRL